MKNYILFLILFIPYLSVGQTEPRNKKTKKNFEKAIISYHNSDTTEAIKYCDKAIQEDENYTEPYILKAQIYSETKNYVKAVILLKKVLKIDSNYTEIYYITGSYLFNNNLLIESSQYFKKYLQKEKNIDKQKNAIRHIEIIDFRIYAFENPIIFKPIRLSHKINTKQKEYFPTISADNSTLIFTRLLNQNSKYPQEDIFISHLSDSIFLSSKSISPLINTQYREGAHTLSTDGMIMIFARCTPNSSCDLYITKKDESGFWLPPVKLASPVNSRYGESQPSLSADGRTLYFVSNRPGGKGKMDIWKTNYLGNNIWSKPTNLGDSINTEGNEMSPFIHFDNKTLYFSSDYLPGMGKFDLFYSKKNDKGNWTKAQNLGYPINTKEDEYRLVVDAIGKKAYFSSERDTTFQQDIYYFNLPQSIKPTKTLYVKAFIFNSINLNPINADFISIIDLKTNDSLFIVKNLKNFIVCLPYGSEYALNISKKGYLFHSQNFTLQNLPDSLTHYDIDIYLSPILIGEKINLKNTFFETDSYIINPKSYVELSNLVEFLTLNKNVHIQIAGHTDNIGSFEHNKKLSENRAKSIRTYLIKNNIDENRITYIGYGYSKPIADNNTEIGRKQNRRTEIIILKK